LEASGKQTELNNSRSPRSSLHAKSLVIDGEIAVVSTSNFDPRSTYLNTECAVIVHDKAFAAALEDNIRRDMAPRNSWVVAERKSTPVIGQFNNLMASISGTLPVLDVLAHSSH
jgi:phosphatidylserine/phosphatidylglycerophosphate/cardiolipin synthase-like enzyme